MACQRKRRKIIPQIPQTIQTSPDSCRSSVSLSKAAMIRPTTAQATGASSTAGCLRTVMTSCSWGSRYLSTSAGRLAPGVSSLMRAASLGCLDRAQEGRDGASGLLQQVQKIVDSITRGCGLGKEIPRQKHDDRPPGDLLELHGQLSYAGTSVCQPSLAQSDCFTNPLTCTDTVPRYKGHLPSHAADHKGKAHPVP